MNDALAAFEAPFGFDAAVDVQVDVQPGLVVRGDRAALVQAVANLLVTPGSTRRPRASASQCARAADPKHVVIAVSDNGLGIAPEEQEAIFEKFQRGSAARDGGGPGTGLGLAIVRAIVSGAPRHIDVRSRGRPRRPLPHRAAPRARGGGVSAAEPAADRW